MNAPVIINIEITTPFRPLRTLFHTAVEVGVIGIGVWVGSAAMQWAGFLALLLLMLGAANAHSKRNKGLTPDEARARIDQIEKEAA